MTAGSGSARSSVPTSCTSAREVACCARRCATRSFGRRRTPTTRRWGPSTAELMRLRSMTRHGDGSRLYVTTEASIDTEPDKRILQIFEPEEAAPVRPRRDGPRDIGGSLPGLPGHVFDFPLQSVESVTLVDAFTLLVALDNNYPAMGACPARPMAPRSSRCARRRRCGPLTIGSRVRAGGQPPRRCAIAPHRSASGARRSARP